MFLVFLESIDSLQGSYLKILSSQQPKLIDLRKYDVVMILLATINLFRFLAIRELANCCLAFSLSL